MNEAQGERLITATEQARDYQKEVSAKIEGVGIMAGKIFLVFVVVLAFCALSAYLGKR